MEKLIGLDITLSDEIRKKAKDKFILVESGTEKSPFDDNTFDTVVGTLVLCSVSDIEKSIEEIKRVLKNNGQYIFIEHILPCLCDIIKIKIY